MYTLEKVLKMKKDTVSGINFLDEAMKVSSTTNSYQAPNIINVCRTSGTNAVTVYLNYANR